MNIVFIGAHPDDCEVYGGGTAALWARDGHDVAFVSVTNGNAGHHEMAPVDLATRRLDEARRSANIAGVSAIVCDHPDGQLEPSLELRVEITRMIRQRRADIVITHRPNDYHPDHRYVSQAVQDSAFMVMVPRFCPDAPRLEHNPIFLYFTDSFTKPAPFKPDVAVDVSSVMDVKWRMLDAMDSQMYEWLPWLHGVLDDVPRDAVDRFDWLKKTWTPLFHEHTKRAFPAIEARFGRRASNAIAFAESFELCEYGRRPAIEELYKLFPER